ncbi:MAG: cyclic lactone autoinducer peptide [Syntrophothermaceae bacterium]
MASLLGLVALGNIGPCCPLFVYQPEAATRETSTINHYLYSRAAE